MEKWYSLSGFNQPISAMSHLVGAIVFLVLSVVLLRRAWHRRSVFLQAMLFSVAVVLLLSMSGVYHMFNPLGWAGRVLIQLDVAAIFLLIAATATPIHGMLFAGWERWAVLVPIWLIAIVGATLRTIFFHSIPLLVGTAIFLAMGWIGGFSGYLLWKRYGHDALFLTIAGGLMYTIGAVGDAFSWPVIIPKVWGPHETFHLFVLAGIGFHWNLITKIVDGKILPRVAAPEIREI